jgi:hypothetical protein
MRYLLSQETLLSLKLVPPSHKDRRFLSLDFKWLDSEVLQRLSPLNKDLLTREAPSLED